MAAEIAAANEKSAMKPVGSVLIPGAATKFGAVKGRVDRTKLNRTSGEYVNSREDSGDESNEEEGEAEEWLGKDEGFVSTLSDLLFSVFRPQYYLKINRKIMMIPALSTISTSLKMQLRREMLTSRIIQWKQSLEKGSVVEAKMETSKEGSR